MPVIELVTSSGLGSLLGMRHALEPDHLAAVSTLVTGERSSAKAALLGVCWGVGHTLALLRKSLFSRLARNRWAILDPHSRDLGDAKEESFSRAVIRKFLGKFDRRFESNVDVQIAGSEAGHIYRRAAMPGAEVDLLTIRGDAVDRRVLIALATLILGSEP